MNVIRILFAVKNGTSYIINKHT